MDEPAQSEHRHCQTGLLKGFNYILSTEEAILKLDTLSSKIQINRKWRKRKGYVIQTPKEIKMISMTK